MIQKIVLVWLVFTGAVFAQQVEMTVLTHPTAVNRYPGADGLVGNSDDVVSSGRTPTAGSAPNSLGSYGFSVLDADDSASDDELPTGFEAISFVSGSATVDQGVLTNGGGPMITGLSFSSGTQPFEDVSYSVSLDAVNGGSYNPSSQQFTLNGDMSFLVDGETLLEPGVALAGTAVFLRANQFAVGSGNTYVDSVLIPLAQAEGASSLLFFDGSGVFPNLGLPVRFVVSAIQESEGAFAINQGVAGTWVNPETLGQGFLIDIDPVNQFMFLAWFSYDNTASAKNIGSPEQRWFTAQGNYSGNSASLPLFVTSGGEFNSGQAVTTEQDGTLDISFEDCGAASADFDIPSASLQGNIPLIRALPATIPLCEAMQ